MSTHFQSLTPIRMADLFDGRLENVGVHEKRCEDTTANSKCLTDGRNFLWVSCDEKGLVSGFNRHGINAPQYIFQAIADEFGVDIVSEHAPQYWGYETTEEWDAASAAMAEQDEHNFYNEVVMFVRGEGGHDLRPGTIGMMKAEIAKRLIAESPDLLAEDKRPDLIKAVEMIYDKDHAVVVELTDDDPEFVRMMASMHEDDLPQA